MKKQMIIPALITTILMTGCSSFNDWILNKGLEKSGISESEDYKTYQSHLDNNELDENGRYIVSGMDEAVPALASISSEIQLSSAKNNKLLVHFYADSSKANEIDLNCFRFQPGETIYVQADTVNDSTLYKFSRMRVWDIDADGQILREMSDVWDGTLSVIHIPEDYTGEHMAIEPLGEYVMSSAVLETYTSDTDGNIQPISSAWTVDGVRYTSLTADLDASKKHNISLQYDGTLYYYNADNSSGFDAEINRSDDTVEFKNVVLNEDECKFSVELSKFISCEIDSLKGISSVKVNGEEWKDKKITRLKENDEITIDLQKNYIAECMQFDYQNSEPIANGNRVTFVIPKLNNDIKIIIAKESDGICTHTGIAFENAEMTVTVVDTGYVLKDGDKISGSTKVTVTICPNEGYYIGGSGVSDNIYKKEMKYSDYLKNRDKLIENIEISDKPIEQSFWDNLNPLNW
ncbi:MAG: hypothetical protein ACI4K7_07090 [Oscillospiraceae bacterium]